MKKTTTLIFLLLTSCFILWSADDPSILFLEQESEAACPCSCNKDNDLAVLQEFYNNNNGANWNLVPNSKYQSLIDNSANFDVPNAGNSWNINAPDAQDQMGNWHGVRTNQAGCVTEIILWSGIYNGGDGVGVTGTLPASLNQLCALNTLMLPHNDITGPLPAGLDDLCNLVVLLLQNNELEGPLPPEIGNMNNLVQLALHDNGFTGTLPTEYMDIPELLILHLRGNKLEGVIPANVDNLEKVVLFDISNNCFSGTVPETIAMMGRNSTVSGLGGGLLQLNLQNNKLDSLPDISSLKFVGNPSRSFDVSGNHFTFDDIIPNRNILTKYDNQTIDLDLYLCLQVGDTIVIQPKFDELIDIPFYGPETRSRYFWARGTNFSTVSNINQISFDGVGPFSAGSFTIEVTNPLAPNLTLLASNLVIDVLDPTITGISTVCTGTNTTLGLNDTYANYNWSTGETTDTIVINNTGTYSVTVSNDMGCTAMNSIEVVASESPDIFIAKTNDLDCDNDIATVYSLNSRADITYAWTDATGNMLGTNTLVEVAIPGIYTLTVSNSDGCTNQASIEVLGGDDIETPEIEGNLSFCEGEVSQLSAIGNYASYAWSTGSSMSTIEVDSTGTYAVTVTSSTGCVAVNSTNVMVTPLPSFSVLGNKSFCPDGNTILAVDTIFSTYNWSTGDTDQEVIFTTPGDYEVTVTNANNCSSVMAFTIEILVPPSAMINGDSTICTGIPISLLGSPLNNTYDWSTGESESFILASAAGTYGLTVTDENGCTSSTTKTLTEIPQPILTLNGDTSICKDGRTTIAVMENYVNYMWSTGANTQTIIVDTAGAYTVTVTNDNGCENQLTHTVTELTGPIIPAEEKVAFCEGDTITLQALEGFTSYQWASGEDTSFIKTSEAMNYFVTVTDENGCTSDMVFIVEENARPVPEIVGDALVCKGTLSSLSISENFDQYLWSTGEIAQTTLIFEPDTYYVTVSNANNCTAIDSFLVTESPSIDLKIVGNTALCEGESTILRADDDYDSYEWSTGETTSTIPVNSAGNYTLTVTDAAGCTGEATIAVIENDILFPQIVGDDFICQSSFTLISADNDYASYIWSTGATSKELFVTSSGTYQLIVTNAAGCTGEVSIDVVDVPLLQPSITGATTCIGETANLGLDTTYASYIWSNGETSSSIDVDAGTYEVTVSNIIGCTSTAQVQVEEQAAFKPSIVMQDSAMCTMGFNSLIAEEGFVTYAWSAAVSTNNLVASSIIFITEPDTYTLTVTDANGCQGIDSVVIAAYPAVKVSPGVTDPFCSGDSIATELSLIGFSTYEWSTGDTIPNIFVERGGTYEVTVTNEFDCEGSTSFEVTEHQSPIVNVNNAGDSILNLCMGEKTILFGVIDNAFDYRWEDENGDQIGLTPILEVDKPGKYSLVVEDKATGCIATESTQIRAIPNPIVLNIDTTSRVLDCENRVTLLDASNSKSVDNFCWEKTEDKAINFLAKGPDISSYEVSSAGNYRLIVQDEETNCRDTAMINVTENIDNLSPVIVEEVGSINIVGSLQVCEGDVAKIKVKDTYQKYKWETGDTTQNLDSIIKPGIYTVTVTDSRACTGSASVEVQTKLTEEIRVEIASDITQVCEGEAVKINFNILSGGTGPYDIDYTDGIMETDSRLGNIRDNVGSIVVTPTSNSRYEITAIVDQGDECRTTNSIDTAFLDFDVMERPIANEIMKSVCAGTGTTDGLFDLTKYINEVNDNSNLPVNWYYEENRDRNITDISKFLTPPTTIYATVLGSCESDPVPVILEVNNCANSLEMTHESGTALDLSHLDGEDREVYITNRWGDLVFASTDYEGFENKFKGTDLPQGAYYIYIKNEEKGLPVPYKGVIYLLKEQ